MSRENRKALKLRAGALTLFLAGVIIGSPLVRGDFQCQTCINISCKMVEAYGQLQYNKKTMTCDAIAAWSFWTVMVNPKTGEKQFTAAQNASGGGGFQACTGDQGGSPKLTDPAVWIKRYK